MKTLALGAAFAALVPIAASAAPTTSALRSIRVVAAHVAARRSIDRSDLRGAAREIALKWAKVEPAFASDGDTIVETEMLNHAIVSFENDWSQDFAKAPVDARDVASAAQDLLDATE